MKPRSLTQQQAGLNVSGILFILFKYKRSILLWTLLGLITAVAVFFLKKPPFQSEAKLYVKYVVEKSAVDSVDSKAGVAASRIDEAINSELEILTSWDLIAEAVDGVGLDKFARGGFKPTRSEVAAGILQGLTVSAKRGSSIISVSYRNRDPELASRVLQELVKQYYQKHLKVHRSVDTFDFETQTDAIRTQLRATETELDRLKREAGVLNVAEATLNMSNALTKARTDLDTAESERAEQQARVEAIRQLLVGKGVAEKQDEEAPRPTNEELENHTLLVEQIAEIQRSESQLISKYGPENRALALIRDQLAEYKKQRRVLERKYPQLAATTKTVKAEQTQDLPTEMVKVAALSAKIESLKQRIAGYEKSAAELGQKALVISELERKRELEETNYKDFKTKLEKARVDEKLDPTKMPNISEVQRPSPAIMLVGERNKMVMGFAAGGLILGLSLAFLLELVLNPTVRRLFDLELALGIPVLMSIPYLNGTSRSRRLALANGKDEGTLALPESAAPAPWEANHFIRRFTDAIRDRLIVSFQLRNMNHKPKLVAVAGFSSGAGSSTLAGGLAASLSETGEGKVLLVNMNVGEGEVHPFFEGRPSSSLAAMLDGGSTKPGAAAAENLYLATVNSPDARNVPMGLRRFYSLMPIIKATDFDYVIFDMPPLGTTSPTLSMAGFMDKVVLVVEAESNYRETVRRTHLELEETRADVSYVFNKVRSHAPRWIEGDN